MHPHSDFSHSAGAFAQFLGRTIGHLVAILLADRDGIGFTSGVFVFGAGVFVRYNYVDFPNVAAWEPGAYGILSFIAITTGIIVAACAGLHSVLRGERGPL